MRGECCVCLCFFFVVTLVCVCLFPTDNELPDYIMVLVMNKKSKEQMDDDLNLFLGHNTEYFTSWLTDVLEKLNSAAAVNSMSAPPHSGNSLFHYYILENSLIYS